MMSRINDSYRFVKMPQEQPALKRPSDFNNIMEWAIESPGNTKEMIAGMQATVTLGFNPKE